MLWTALYLPQLPLDCYAQTHAAQPFAVVEKRRIHMANAAARAAGVRVDKPLSAALALEPALQWQEREPRAEKAALEALSLWALQYTSAISLAAPHGLLLETGGSAKLFGGLDALLKQIAAGTAEQNYSAVFASAPTPAGALMLARSGYAEHITTLPELRRLLPGLPVSSLISAQAYASTFDSLGARTIADLMALPRDGLKRRFGDFLLDEIDRAFGHAPDPVHPIVPPQAFSCALPLPAPAESSTALVFASGRGLRQLEGFLRASKRAVDRIELTLHHERNTQRDAQDDTVLTLHLMQPSADARRFTLLLSERLNRHTLERRVERITLRAPQLLRAEEVTHSLLLEEENAAKDMRDLLERLNARLGQQAIQRLQVRADHRPARASGGNNLLEADERVHTAARKKPKEPLPLPVFGPRPAWLLEPPRPLSEVNNKPFYEGPLKLLSSAERIESGWWDGGKIRRDYFIAETADGALVWIFRDHKQPLGWFLQGYFA
ncbi:MAG: repair nucleotidyltransferase [Betaproteobacteria bacterium]|nr:repair nucleotidyltransferase [Betaproteobacteria bacterium]